MDEAVFEAVAKLVASREYLDDLYARPGVHLPGGQQFLQLPGGPPRQILRRGSPEHQAAKAAGVIDPLPPLEPATAAALEEAEASVGHALPPLLRRLYREVANGGFGPGYGIFGLTGGHPDPPANDALQSYRQWVEWGIPRSPLWPLCTWGCGIYSFVDLGGPPWTIWGHDPAAVRDEQWSAAFAPQAITFAEWLGRWVDGKLFQPVLVQDETGGPCRAATDDEVREWLTAE